MTYGYAWAIIKLDNYSSDNPSIYIYYRRTELLFVQTITN